jgi:predicted enzyme related to lactoylglutathione lyase
VSSNIRAIVANVEVENLEDAIPLYRDLAGVAEVRRFPYRELEVALVGPFLLYSGPLEKYVSQNATVIVESLTPVLDALGKAGAEILEAPNEVPNGTRIVARHPDGSVFEYMQPRS